MDIACRHTWKQMMKLVFHEQELITYNKKINTASFFKKSESAHTRQYSSHNTGYRGRRTQQRFQSQRRFPSQGSWRQNANVKTKSSIVAVESKTAVIVKSIDCIIGKEAYIHTHSTYLIWSSTSRSALSASSNSSLAFWAAGNQTYH